jgi:hypothetical protein
MANTQKDVLQNDKDFLDTIGRTGKVDGSLIKSPKPVVQQKEGDLQSSNRFYDALNWIKRKICCCFCSSENADADTEINIANLQDNNNQSGIENQKNNILGAQTTKLLQNQNKQNNHRTKIVS